MFIFIYLSEFLQKHRVGDWILQKVIRLASGFCVQVSRIYKRAFWKKNHRKTINKAICKKEQPSPMRTLRKLDKQSLSRTVADEAVRFQIRRPTEPSCLRLIFIFISIDINIAHFS